jgi:hypothetical protein
MPAGEAGPPDGRIPGMGFRGASTLPGGHCMRAGAQRRVRAAGEPAGRGEAAAGTGVHPGEARLGAPDGPAPDGPAPDGPAPDGPAPRRLAPGPLGARWPVGRGRGRGRVGGGP